MTWLSLLLWTCIGVNVLGAWKVHRERQELLDAHRTVTMLRKQAIEFRDEYAKRLRELDEIVAKHKHPITDLKLTPPILGV